MEVHSFLSLEFPKNKTIAVGVIEGIFPPFYIIHFHWWCSVIYEVQLNVMFISGGGTSLAILIMTTLD